MAAVTSNSGGFSYAQAAKGRSPAVTSSQASSSKVTSGSATPATGTFSELAPGGNWADDVEATVDDKGVESPKPTHELSNGVQVKGKAVERTKSEDKAQQSTSGVSSPELGASSSTTTNNDDSSSGPTNGPSSDSTWETKSQASEPAWIAERKERQSSSNNSDNTVKGEKKRKESPTPPAPKPIALQDAAPPPVNPWMKRAEENKAKLAAQKPVAKPVVSASPAGVSTGRENQRPAADTRKKSSPVAGLPRNGEPSSGANSDSRKAGESQNKRVGDARVNGAPQSSKPSTDDAAAAGTARPGVQTRPTPPSTVTAPPPVKDQVSWPTPDTIQDKERKESLDKDNSEKPSDDATPSAKPRKKWEQMVVTPNIIFETQNIRGRDSRGPLTGERGGRGGLRGRGGYRGGANGTNGGDRSAGRMHLSDSDISANAGQRGRSNTVDAEAMPPHSKPNRPSSESSRHESNTGTRLDNTTKANGNADGQSLPKSAKSEPKAPDERGVPETWVAAEPDASRTKSPGHIDTSPTEAKSEERIPEPIPRRSFVSTRVEGDKPVSDGAARDGPPIRMVMSDGRKELRGSENGPRESNPSAPPRGGGKRGGRGRGGSREFPNSHQANHTFGNGEFTNPAAFGTPASPSYPGARSGHQVPYPQAGRGGWTRGGPRSQSIPLENFYNRFGNSYAPTQQLPPIQTYVPGMYDYNGYPLTAMPYQQYMEHDYLFTMVNMQLEYYFSLDNLLKDMFLRKNMDSQGFVFLDVIAKFNRVKQLTTDKELLKAVCVASETIEIRVGEDGNERLRRREGWDQFLLPMERREPSAQNDGPKHLQRLEKPVAHVHGQGPNRGPQGMHQQRFDRRPYDAGYPMVNGMPPQFAGFQAVPEAVYAEMVNGDGMRGRTTKSPLRENEMSSSQQLQADDKDAESDAFADDQVNSLTVIVKVNRQRHPYHTAATRTFSNGSIDSRSIIGEIEKSSEGKAAPATNEETLTNGTSGSASASRHASPSTSRPGERAAATPDISLYWMKDEKEPSSDLPGDVSGESYVQLRLKALDQRNHAATGTCPYDLEVLYQFWCHFLIRNFNSRMYNEFHYFATQDAKDRHNFSGLQNLVKFYAQALLSHNPIRDRLVREYVALVNTEPSKLDGAAFKQLRSAWRNGALNLKNRKKLADTVDDTLKERLET